MRWLSDLLRRPVQPDQFGADRDPRWRHVRRQHISRQPRCLACGTSQDLEVHHIADFSTYPHLELHPDNLVTLCGFGGNGCHFRLGHLGNWRKINPSVVFDALTGRDFGGILK